MSAQRPPLPSRTSRISSADWVRFVPWLPPFEGAPIWVRFVPAPVAYRGKLLSEHALGQPVHAGSFLRERRVVLDRKLQNEPDELRRILAHELFHFVWIRLGNARRRSWYAQLEGELATRARGELGWSAEWRKRELKGCPPESRRWRDYACESFCDTAAWLYAGSDEHDEATLAPRFRDRRRRWFERLDTPLPI